MSLSLVKEHLYSNTEPPPVPRSWRKRWSIAHLMIHGQTIVWTYVTLNKCGINTCIYMTRCTWHNVFAYIYIYIYILCRYILYIKYNHIYCIYNFINNFIYIYMSDLCRYLHVQISAMFIMCHGHHVSSNIIRKKYYWRIWFIFIYHQFPDIVLIHSETI